MSRKSDGGGAQRATSDSTERSGAWLSASASALKISSRPTIRSSPRLIGAPYGLRPVPPSGNEPLRAAGRGSCRRERGVDRDAFVEHEAVAPPVRRAVGLLEVLEDAAFELVDVLDAGLAHRQCRLLAADAAGAVADDGLALQCAPVRRQRGREVAELGQAPVDRAVEGAGIDLEAVARVEHHQRAPRIVAAL